MNITEVGQGKVVLLAGGGKVFTDIAARFVGSNRSLDDIVGSEYNKNIVKRILESGHLAATEFDYFVFGVEGYSRVTETQLVRKRHAAYCIKSGRSEKGGKREFDLVLPKNVKESNLTVTKIIEDVNTGQKHNIEITVDDLLGLIENFYNKGVKEGIPEEDLRYLKPQATEFKGLIGMNAHALIDFFNVRCCERAQAEIRDMAWKMLKLCKKASPDLFKNAGPKCFNMLYCPENEFMPEVCKRKGIPTKNETIDMLLKNDKTVIYNAGDRIKKTADVVSGGLGDTMSFEGMGE